MKMMVNKITTPAIIKLLVKPDVGELGAGLGRTDGAGIENKRKLSSWTC
jgi:hypothetical protein